MTDFFAEMTDFLPDSPRFMNLGNIMDLDKHDLILCLSWRYNL